MALSSVSDWCRKPTTSVTTDEKQVFQIHGVNIDLSGFNQPDNIRVRHAIQQGFEGCSMNDSECDLTVIIGDKKINAHRALFSARIPFFRALFASNMADCSSEEIKIFPDFCEFDLESIEALLHYAYTGCLLITEANVQDLMMAAVYLNIESIVGECAGFMSRRIRVDNALPLLSFFRSMGLYAMEDFVFRFMDANFVPISFTTEFLELPENDLVTFLKRDSLYIDNEQQVFEAASRWIDHDFGNRQRQAPVLLKCVRCTRLTETFLTETVERSDWVRRNLECLTLVDQAKGFIQNRFDVNSFKTTSRCCYDARRIIFAWVDRQWKDEDDDSGGSTLELYDPVNNTWTEIDADSDGRDWPCAQLVVVQNKLYFLPLSPDEADIADMDEAELKNLNTCDVYDVVTNEWSKIPSMSIDRRGVMASAVVDGKIYVAGGYDPTTENEHSSVEFYDPSAASPVWLPLKCMSRRRERAAACELDGKFYIIGGRNGRNNWSDGECYDPNSDTWTSISGMAKVRCDFTAAALKGKIYVAGGCDSDDKPMSDVESYDPVTDTWTTLSSLSIARYAPKLAVSCGKLFAVGGCLEEVNYSCLEMYHPETDTWEERMSMRNQETDDCPYFGVLTVPASFPSPIPMLETPVPHENCGFRHYNLKEEILRAIVECRFDHPSEAQDGCIPRVMLGQDLICQAEPGSGKTTAFVIATLQQLDPIEGQIAILVICRNPKVANQMGQEYKRFAKYLPTVKVGVFSEVDENEEFLEGNCPNIVIGTPGWLLALGKSGFLAFNRLTHLVIDDCEKIFNKLLTVNQILKIAEFTPEPRQIMMISSNTNNEFGEYCQEFLDKMRADEPQVETKSTEANGFSKFHLKSKILRAIADSNIDTPSDAQNNWIPLAFITSNTVFLAASGAGKTTAFIIATLQQLEPIDGEVSVLIICRTPELAAEIGEQYDSMAKYLTAVNIGIFAEDVNDGQFIKGNCPHVAIGTPGGLLALANNGRIEFDRVKHLVIDDCDEIIDDFTLSSQVLTVVKSTPPQKQVVLISSNIDRLFRQRCLEFIEKVRKLESKPLSLIMFCFVIACVCLLLWSLKIFSLHFAD